MPEEFTIPGITVEEAADGIRLYAKTLNEDPYYQHVIKPMIDERLRYEDSFIGKLIPWNPLERALRKLKIECFILKVLFCGCIGAMVILIILRSLLIISI